MFMEIEDVKAESGNPQDLVAEARALISKTAPKGKITNGADAYLFDMRGPAILFSLCNELEQQRSDADRLRAALEAIVNIAGNLSDERVESVNGVNDARSRASMVVTARQIAQNALAKGEVK